jgi:hypothetical protein
LPRDGGKHLVHYAKSLFEMKFLTVKNCGWGGDKNYFEELAIKGEPKACDEKEGGEKGHRRSRQCRSNSSSEEHNPKGNSKGLPVIDVDAAEEVTHPLIFPDSISGTINDNDYGDNGKASPKRKRQDCSSSKTCQTKKKKTITLKPAREDPFKEENERFVDTWLKSTLDESALSTVGPTYKKQLIANGFVSTAMCKQLKESDLAAWKWDTSHQRAVFKGRPRPESEWTEREQAIKQWILKAIRDIHPSDLRSYTTELLDNGFDTVDMLSAVEDEDLVFMKKGHRKIILRCYNVKSSK